MRYNEILELYDYFEPAYDIMNEKENYWKRFIPTDDFIEILNTFLISLEDNQPLNRRSLWLHGIYGVGKSHATGVFKHLLSDPLEKINDYIENISDVQVKQKLKAYRERNRVFPVTLKGLSGIHNIKSFVLTIEKAVKNSLKKEGIDIRVKSDFEKYIEHIKKEKSFINWDIIIESDSYLNSQVKSLDELLDKLENYDVDTLDAIEESLEDISIQISDISYWLTEVCRELKKCSPYNALVLFWDEFTSVIESKDGQSFISIIQNIAEQTKENDVYLFIISHKSPEQLKNYDKDNFQKVLDRFHAKNYRMQEITTYHILEKAIRKKEKDIWEEIKNNIFSKYNGFDKIFFNILGHEAINKRKILMDLFPFHPYTVYISTKLAERIGSTERSIFNFLYDNEYGFSHLINLYPKENGNDSEYFITADKLWDFFYNEFQNNEDSRIQSVISKYNFLPEIQKKDEAYADIFKGVLLLNILHFDIPSNISGELPYSPKEENVEAMFFGTSLQKYVKEVLNYIDERGYIQKNPDGYYLITTTPIPQDELLREIEESKSYFNDITKSLTEDNKEKIKDFLKVNLLREVMLKVYPANLKRYDIERKINSDFPLTYTLNIAFFVAKDESEINKLKLELNSFINDEKNKGIIEDKKVVFIISLECLGEKDFNRIVEYEAKARVCQKHHFDNDKNNNINYRNKIFDNWINNILQKDFYLIFEDMERNILSNNISTFLNDTIIPKIFKSGPEKIKDINKNLWSIKSPITVVELFLFKNLRSQIEEELRVGANKPLINILKDNNDYIVDEKLKFKKDYINSEHILAKISSELDKEISKFDGQSFNLGKVTKFLQNPPFGLYRNSVSHAILSFVMRKYVDKLYQENDGTKISKELMRDKILSIFNYWENSKDEDKLNVRMGSEDETKLAELLCDLFNFTNKNESLNKVLWSIGDWIKDQEYPIWSLKYYKESDEHIGSLVECIIYLIKIKEKDVNQEEIRKIYQILDLFKEKLRNMLNKEVLKQGFCNFVKNIENVEFNEDDLSDLMEFLKQNMMEEVKFWDITKVESKIKDWHIQKDKTKLERDFIKLIESIFSISNSSSIQELRINLRNIINKDLKIPVRFLSYIFDREDIKNSIMNLDNFINEDQKYDSDTLTEIYETIVSNSTILSQNINKNILKDSFLSYLKQKYNMNDDLSNKFYLYFVDNFEKDFYNFNDDSIELEFEKFNFIRAISSIFKISNFKSFEELIIAIKNKIYESNYPFWINELSNDNRMKVITEIIIDVIKTRKIPEASIMNNFCKTYNDLSKLPFKIIDNIENEKIFLDWLKQELGIKYPEEVVKAARRNLSNENYYLDKVIVENWIRKNGSYFIPDDIKEQVKEKIRKTDKNVKEILLKMIDNHKEIINWIEDYL